MTAQVDTFRAIFWVAVFVAAGFAVGVWHTKASTMCSPAWNTMGWFI